MRTETNQFSIHTLRLLIEEMVVYRDTVATNSNRDVVHNLITHSNQLIENWNTAVDMLTEMNGNSEHIFNAITEVGTWITIKRSYEAINETFNAISNV